ncbi:MAG: hypothetical protein HYY04_11685 [Chloroflexi bacterium]|nr:hypothetical protein [Chloroflexota bacterium]
MALKMATVDTQPLQWVDLGHSAHIPHSARLAPVPAMWIEVLQGKREPWPTGLDGRWAVEMCLGAYQSARLGRRVTFPLE